MKYETTIAMILTLMTSVGLLHLGFEAGRATLPSNFMCVSPTAAEIMEE